MVYYYAYINSANICEQVYAMPSPITGSNYILLDTYDTSLIGKRYNNGVWEEVTWYYYAKLDDRDIVIEIVSNPDTALTGDDLISIPSADTSLIGKWYNRETQQFVEAPIHVLAMHSTDEINVGDEDKWLTTEIDEIATDIANLADEVDGKADTAHTHSEYALAEHTHTGYAPAEHTHSSYAAAAHSHAISDITELDSALTAIDGDISTLETSVAGKAAADHTHTNYALTEHTHSGYAAANHTHSEYATTTSVSALETAVNGKADTDHTHSGYATTTALNNLTNVVNGKAETSHSHAQSDITGLSTALAGKASTSHTHSEYAASNHTHSGYAASSHTHSDYLSTSGGTVSGNLNVTGIVRVNSQQALYDSGTMITLSTNNRQTMIAGSAIYSKVQISVSSDERLKENINTAPTSDLVKFVENLNIKTYNYIGKEEEENIGVIAQELIKENPDLAKYFVRQDENGYYSVKTADLVFPLIVAVQQLAKEIEQLKK